MAEKTQILMIHGGNSFKNRKTYIKYLKNRKISIKKSNNWATTYFDEKLGKKFEIIRPRMPTSENAKYKEWKIHFERYFPYLKNNIILIGNSLGGIFIAKYLSENKFPKKILSTYLVAPPSNKKNISGGFRLKADLSLAEKNSKKIIILFSKDDKVVSISNAKEYRKKLKNAKIIIYKRKGGHFRVLKFPEIIKMIKKDIKEYEKLN